LVADGHIDNRALHPTRNFGTPIHQRVLGVLELKDSRPRQMVGAVDDPSQDREDGGGFASDAVLALIIERPIETV
jgi:hypothetical protein